jgi:cystathionine beta-lyase
VLHPALPSCPGHEIWKRDFTGASGVFSLVLKPDTAPQLDAALSAMSRFAIGASWGGTRSLLVPMSVKADRIAVAWPEDGMILRVSVGLEDPAELWDDLSTLLNALKVR